MREDGDAAYEALEKLSSGTLTLPHTKPLVAQFEKIKKVLAGLEPFKDDVPKLIDELFPAADAAIAELRELALTVMEEAEDAQDLFGAMMKEITQPDIPPEVKEVRVMSLHKSKGSAHLTYSSRSVCRACCPRFRSLAPPRRSRTRRWRKRAGSSSSGSPA